MEVSYYSGLGGLYSFIYVTATNSTTSDNELKEFYYFSTDNRIYEYRSFTDPNYNPNLVAVSGSYVYLLQTRNTDLEPPPEYNMVILSKYPSAFAEVGRTADTSGYASDLRVSGGKAYAVDAIGMQVYSVATPTAPAKSEFLDTPGNPSGVDTNGSYAFLASGLSLFQVVDLRLPGAMSVAGTYAASGLYGMAVRDNYVYAAAASPPSARLQVLNIANPASPSPVGSLAITGATDVALSGPYAFVTAGTGGLKVVDISNPLAPSLLSSANPISSYLERVEVKGDYAFVAAGTGVQVYDISDPTQPPVGIGIFDSDGGGMQDVKVRGSRIYVTDGAYFQPNSFKVLNVGQPSVPGLDGKGLTAGMIVGYLALSGDWAFISDAGPGMGLWAVNINPSSASFMTAYGPCDTLPGAGDCFGAAGVDAFGGYAYVLDPAAGLVLVNISNPASLSNSSLVTSLSLGANPQDLLLNGKYALCTDSSSGLRIVSLFP